MQYGHNLGVPADDYHAHPAVSKTQIAAWVAGDPLSKIRYMREDRDDSTTEAKEFGSSAHAVILEGAPMSIIPDACDLRTKDGKALRDQIRADAPPNAVELRETQARALADITAALRGHSLVGAIMDEEHETEVSMLWREMGVDCKCRYDVWPADQSTPPLDLKFVRSVRGRDIERAIRSYGWDIQRIHYRIGHRECGFDHPPLLLVLIEKFPPYEIRVAELDAAWAEWATARRREGLEAIAAAIQVDSWPGYPQCLYTLTAPYWMEKELERMYQEQA